MAKTDDLRPVIREFGGCHPFPSGFLNLGLTLMFFSGSYVIHLLAYHRMSTTLGARLQTGPSGISQLVSTPLTDGLHAP